MQPIQDHMEEPLCWFPVSQRPGQYELLADNTRLACLDMRTWATTAYASYGQDSFVIRREGDFSSQALICPAIDEEPLGIYDHKHQDLQLRTGPAFLWSGAHMFCKALAWLDANNQPLIHYELQPQSLAIPVTIESSALLDDARLPLLMIMGFYIIACDRRDAVATSSTSALARILYS